MPHGFAPDRLDRIGEVLKTRYVDSGAIPGALTLVWRRGALAHQSLSGISTWNAVRRCARTPSSESIP